MTTHDIDTTIDWESIKQEAKDYVPKSNEPAAIKAEPIWANPMDWLTFAMLVIVVLDHLRKQISWLRFGGSNKKARDSGLFEQSFDETAKKSTLRNRKRGKKGRKENQLKQLEIDDDEKALREAKKTAPTGINFYDIAKIYAVVTMMIDHYGYFGLPGISYSAARWTRVIGRTSAPMFFFLIGYSGSFRFRWHTWCYAVFLFVCNGWLNLRLTATSFESLVIVLTVNWVFSYINLEKLLNKHWSLQFLLFVPLALMESYTSDTLRIAYGSQAYMLIIAGYLTKRGNKFGKFWSILTMIHYAYLACNVFANTDRQFAWICGLLTLETMVFVFANKLGKAEYEFSATLPKPVRNFLLYISRNALIVYIVHLQMFRLIQMKVWNW